HWMPRRALGGTYDDTWVRERAPLWPADVDRRFLSAAAPGLFASPHLEGGEDVDLVGVDADGPIRFRLPRRRLVAKLCFRARVERIRLRVEAVMLERDARAVTLIWRASASAHPGMHALEACVVRELEPWET